MGITARSQWHSSVMRTPVRSRLTGNRKGTRMEKRTFNKSAPLDQRFEEQAKRLRREAKGTPPEIEREKLIRLARQAETAAHIQQWLTSPGLQAPG
jgi:broad specificity phosphatase PhoE